MKKQVMIKNRSISYIDNNNDSGHSEATILFIHGNSCSSDFFEEQFNGLILSKFRLVAIDLFGHGASKKLEDKQGYNIKSYAELIHDFISALNLDNVILAGHSLGGHIALEASKDNFLKKLKGIFIWGTPPLSNPPDFAKAFLPAPFLPSFFKGELGREEIIGMVECMSSESLNYMDKYVHIIEQSAPEARESLASSIGKPSYTDEIDLIEKSDFEIGIIYGLQEKIVNPEYIESLLLTNIWRGKPIAINSGHLLHIESAHQFNSLLGEYTDEMLARSYSNHREAPVFLNAAARLVDYVY